jgi:hypothetical protein
MAVPQKAMYYRAVRQSAEAMALFSDMVRKGEISRADLEKLIAKRPEVYGKYAGFLGKLK